MKVLLRKGCSLLSADLSAALRRIPAASFRRTLESAFSYMEILVSGVSDGARASRLSEDVAGRLGTVHREGVGGARLRRDERAAECRGADGGRGCAA